MSRWPLTPRGTGAVLIAVLCLILAQALGVPALVFFGVLLLAAVGISLASLWVGHRDDGVRRSFAPSVVGVGGDVDVRARIESRTLLPTVVGLWEDRLPRGIEGEPAGVYPGLRSGLIAGSHAVDVAYRVTARRRGVRPIGPLVVQTTDPFGLARRTQQLGSTVPLTVTPSIVELEALEDLPGAAGGTMQTTTNKLGEGADNLIPRAYLPGDSMRRIHWRASAHRGELMVRQEERESNPEAVVVFDRSLARWSADALRAPGEDAGFEAAVSAVASATSRFVREGYAVSVVDVDGTELVETIDGGDSAALEAMVIGFATLTARRDGSLSQVAPLFAGSTLGPVAVVTGEIDDADAAALAPVVGHSSLPVLFALGGEGDALRIAAEGGWRVRPLEAEDEIDRLWVDVARADFAAAERSRRAS
ncbi:DUF58 domain-containing protein [Microbacterium sp. EYE_5]|uniref:DUF58 domain-containing protein n=1 Tax=unclassified Microbacterium TaxID=2609290 RepID=UPI002005CDF6|nr:MULTISPECIES: DUF58 domain-containing protein [unclassified Microbacterium]MCK6080317.1 DUF58 domain-containing protein [Microbacterium sp. EYE_382]MCK6085588.1 DUF58 domain-containing protein [Microbacterium sp. EYE_384]MCK6122187.1 DUF58 domain-containing protein [Microbacterium sp. EYE_80]MCK6126351.1 DUF58 domain-containing protein [Microbacterium sp. EYE_79]MCK6141272.1 DUF58 domain-containing protein [Microbacterium sp. EYE_39]